MLQLIKQPANSSLCLAACCAMLTGKSFAQVYGTMLAMNGLQKIRGTNIETVSQRAYVAYLAINGYRTGLSLGFDSTVKFNHNFINGQFGYNVSDILKFDAVVKLRTGYGDSPELTVAHACVWCADSQHILDPIRGELHMQYVYDDVLFWEPVQRISEN